MAETNLEVPLDDKRFVPPPFWSAFPMRAKLNYLRGDRPAPKPRPKPNLRSTLWSWCYFAAWGLTLPAAIYTLTYQPQLHPPLLRWALYGILAVLVWTISRKSPVQTVGQLALCLFTCLAALAFGIVQLWDSPVVIPLVPVFLFFLFLAVLLARVFLARRRTTQPV